LHWLLEEILRGLLFVALVAGGVCGLLCVDDLLYPAAEATVVGDGSGMVPVEALRGAMHYHGIAFADCDANGWYFMRKGKRCGLWNGTKWKGVYK